MGKQAKIIGFFTNQRGDTTVRLSNNSCQTLYKYMWEQNYGKVPKGCQIHHIGKKRYGKNGNEICSLKDLMLVTPVQHKYFHRKNPKKTGSKNRSKRKTKGSD